MVMPDDIHGREAMLASMRRTLLLMEAMGAKPEILVDVLETAARELREELKRRKHGQH
jgi:hypothetical protein